MFLLLGFDNFRYSRLISEINTGEYFVGERGRYFKCNHHPDVG
jgi:hypothetical protein